MNRLLLSPLSAAICVVVIWILLTSPVSGQDDTIRILIDTKALTLKVMQGDQEKVTFSDIVH